MIKLGVNIDHSATLRQARYKDVLQGSTIVVEPSVLDIALMCEDAGADSITAHLREDRRHIVDADIYALKKSLRTKLNLEMSCAESVLDVALKVAPDYACIVPENRNEVTTEGGLDLISNFERSENVVKKLSNIGTICSMFIDPENAQLDAAKKMGAPVVELHTGAFANAWGSSEKYQKELERIAKAADYGRSIGLVVNAGHGINYLNISDIVKVQGINELNIGHSIICRALFVGIKQAVAEMKAFLK